LGGGFIQRVVLVGGGAPDGLTAVLDAPAAEVAVPVGEYARW